MESPAPTAFTKVPFGAGASYTLPSSATSTAPSPAIEIRTFLGDEHGDSPKRIWRKSPRSKSGILRNDLSNLIQWRENK